MSCLAKKYGTYERQMELLNLLKLTHSFLIKNGIKYSLCGGTLLGAVREGGFIPWDDDVDIMMDRANYIKLVNLFSSKHEDIGLELKRVLWVDRIQKTDSTKDLTEPTIDVFVMDNSPDNIIIRKLKTILIMLLQGMMKKENSDKEKAFYYKLCLFFTKVIGMPFSDDTKFKWYNTIAQIGNSSKTEYITGFTDSFNLLTVRYSGKLFDQLIYQKFEDTMFPITAEYDNYLTVQYGDYMTPPPIEERVPLHK